MSTGNQGEPDTMRYVEGKWQIKPREGNIEVERERETEKKEKEKEEWLDGRE